MTMQIAVLVGAVLQDFREGQRPLGGEEHPPPRLRKHVAGALAEAHTQGARSVPLLARAVAR